MSPLSLKTSRPSPPEPTTPAHSPRLARSTAGGANAHGQLGDSTSQDHPTPTNVAGLASGITAIAAGDAHTCALSTEGAIQCWGSNSDGQLGDGTTESRSTPVQVSGLTSGIAAIAADGGRSCAISDHGNVQCWGRNFAAGLGANANSSTPTDIPQLSSGIDSIAVSDTQTCILSAGGSMQCWGPNAYGHEGTSAIGGRVATIALGNMHTCALTTDGRLFCWGDNSDGQLGDPVGRGRSTPARATSFAGSVAAVSAGQNRTCVITSEAGAIECVGDLRLGVPAAPADSIVAADSSAQAIATPTPSSLRPAATPEPAIVRTPECANVTQIAGGECDALVAFYNSAGGAAWTDSSGWLVSDTPCSWFGVTCRDSHVHALSLDRNHLTGTIAAELGNLANLNNLSLSTNALTGAIPAELGTLSRVYHVALYSNRLSGNIPPELGNLTTLGELKLDGNRLTGVVPAELGNLQNLKILGLNGNQLTGSLPPELAHLAP
jgi:hypothetical protein